MEAKKWGALGLGTLLLIGYNASQPDLIAMRTTDEKYPGTKKDERYGPSLVWLDRLMAGQAGSSDPSMARETKLDFNVLSSMMVAGLASGFKSQVANLLWMKSDEYWHKGLLTRQVPLMEAVVTLDPQFIEAWSTAGWHWAYNIYADLPERADLKKTGPNSKALRKEQERAILIGLDYLKRGANLNPETYRLWFENAWTRGEKAGIYDEETVRLMRTARAQKDSRQLERTIAAANGKSKTTQVQGDDIVGRNIGHIYEKMPLIDKALDEYMTLITNGGLRKEFPMSEDASALPQPGSKTAPQVKPITLSVQQRQAFEKIGCNDWDIVQISEFYAKATPQNKAVVKAAIPQIDEVMKRAAEIRALRPQLSDAGMYWGLYGSDYVQIAQIYRNAESVQRAQIKRLVPDVERLVAAQAARETTQEFETQATGAFISITARYVPAWQQMQRGDLQGAVNTIIGVMNADGIHHVKKMPVLAQVLALRGDAPDVTRNMMEQAKQFENDSSQEIGLHLLATLYEKQAAKVKGTPQEKVLMHKAYESWYRGRERNNLNFYSRRNTLLLEDKYGFKVPQNIVDQVKKARKSGSGVNAAPAPPNVSQYQKSAA